MQRGASPEPWSVGLSTRSSPQGLSRVGLFSASPLRSHSCARIQGASHRRRARGHDVGIDLGGLNAVVAQQFLDRANIHASLQEVSRERKTQRVTADRLQNAGGASGMADRPAQGLVMQVMPTEQGRSLPSSRRHHPATVGRQGSDLFRAGFDAESGRKDAGLVRFPVPVFDASNEDGQGLFELGESAGVNRGLCVLERIKKRLGCKADIRPFNRVGATVVKELLKIPSPPVRLLGRGSNLLIIKESYNLWRRTSIRLAFGAVWIGIHGSKSQTEARPTQRKNTLKCNFIGLSTPKCDQTMLVEERRR